ncbi:helix-turn-helix transcriptional regulator [Bacteroidia bacterium]|nr:helix-turn-helix transcriptional regulator [Bacteroidia bacterium]
MKYPDKRKIAIIEPSPVIREGMKKLLEEITEYTVSCMYCDFQAFQDKKNGKSFDIILINPVLVSFYKQFYIRSLFPDYPDSVIAALLYGYADGETLAGFDGVLSVYDDSVKMDKKLRLMTKTPINGNGNGADNIDLSNREKEILVSIAKGLTNKEIADKHCISVHTAISHRKNISRKTGIKTISGLTIYAIFNNLISQEDL